MDWFNNQFHSQQHNNQNNQQQNQDQNNQGQISQPYARIQCARCWNMFDFINCGLCEKCDSFKFQLLK